MEHLKREGRVSQNDFIRLIDMVCQILSKTEFIQETNQILSDSMIQLLSLEISMDNIMT